MRIKEFHRPQTVDQVLALLSQNGNAKLLAGGTDLVIALKERAVQTAVLIDLSGVEELRGIYEEGDVLHIGAGATFTDIQYSPLVAKYCPALCEAAAQMGAVQVRNLATLGGNVANAATAADGVPALLAMGAVAVIKQRGGVRTIPVGEVLTGINQTCLAPDEVITEFQMTAQPGAAKVFQKIGRRKSLAIARINLALCAHMDGSTVKNIRVAVGAVGKTCYCVPEVEAFLAGKVLKEDTINQAADLMNDVVARNLAGRSTTPYKRKIARAVLKRGLERVVGGEGT